MNITNKKIMVIAGEASGDLHGAHLAKALTQTQPNLKLFGVGGNKMQEAGIELIANISDISVCGFVEVLRYLPKFYKLFKRVTEELKRQRPDLLVLIDYPSFNLKIAKIADKLNVKVLYYISPQLWAWHTSRIKKIKSYVSMMAVIFPFEADFYRKHSVPVKYVGHPLAHLHVNQYQNNTSTLTNGRIVIGLLPGSRKNEIKYILPILLNASQLLSQKRNHIKFLLPLANTISKEDIDPYLKQCEGNIEIIKENHYEAMSQCDAVIAASGTVTLELALLGIPMVIVYKGNAISYMIARRLVKIPYIGLCNIIAGKKIVAELLQHNANSENISAEILKLLEDIPYREKQKEALAMVAQKLRTEKECSIAELTFDVLNV